MLVLGFLCFYLPASAVIVSFLHTPASPDTFPSTLGFATIKCTLAHTGSASVAIATWLHALHPHQVWVMVGKKYIHACLHQGEMEIQSVQVCSNALIH